MYSKLLYREGPRDKWRVDKPSHSSFSPKSQDYIERDFSLSLLRSSFALFIIYMYKTRAGRPSGRRRLGRAGRPASRG